MIEEGVLRKASATAPKARILGVWIPARVRLRSLGRDDSWKMDPQDVDVKELIHLLIGVDAPQPLLLDPAVEAVAGNTAPAGRAMLDLGYHPGLQAGCNRAGWIRAIVQRREFVLGFHWGNRRAAARQPRVMGPA